MDPDIRLWIYRFFIDRCRAPSPAEIGSYFGLRPADVESSLRRLQDDADAIVLLPDSPYLWMAEPFSALPTSYPVHSGDKIWWGNCIWDALAILALTERDGLVETTCAHSGGPLAVEVADGRVVAAEGVAHFAVAARDWWRSIGFT